MAEQTFAEFLARHRRLKEAYEVLAEEDEILACSLETVFKMQGESVGPIADEILGYVQTRTPDALEEYVARVRKLRKLQRAFEADPSPATLGAPGEPVQRASYDVALLLSIVFTNHRFEIMQSLLRFLGSMGDQGAIASIGMGSGYELVMIARTLDPRWSVEGYDTDAASHATARQLLDHFGVSREVAFGERFSVAPPAPADRARLDAIVLCEVLEHLHDPLAMLVGLRLCLKPHGRMFVTMAVNIAQEDHVFLYPDLDSCRSQLRHAGLQVVEETITPATIYPIDPDVDRESSFYSGNYVAVVQPEAEHPPPQLLHD